MNHFIESAKPGRIKVSIELELYELKKDELQNIIGILNAFLILLSYQTH